MSGGKLYNPQGAAYNAANPFAGYTQYNGKTYAPGKGKSVGVKGSSAAAPGGSAPAPEAPAAMPWNGAIDSSINTINTGLNNKLSYLNAEEGRQRARFGVEDDSDPFSEMANLRKSFETAKRSSNTSMSAVGQLYSGALQNAQDTNRFNFTKGEDSVKKAWADAKAGFEQQRLQAQNDAQSQIDQFNLQRLDYALNNPIDDPAPVGASGGGAKTFKMPKGLSKEQRQAINRRTTPSSKARLAKKFGY